MDDAECDAEVGTETPVSKKVAINKYQVTGIYSVE
jgi:hypothetical protein